MKRLRGSDSLIPICPSAPHSEEKASGMYGMGFLDGIEDDECGEELCSSGQPSSEKKRRLSTEQVRSLEKNFEVENKLDPERKVRLAQDLGLQPRQVAVWFQNRRARWKTKQLERDYSALKSSYDALRVDFDELHHDKQALLAEIKELKDKLADDEIFCSVKAEPLGWESDIKASEVEEEEEEEEPPTLIYKDGSSDSDSSAVVNDDSSPYETALPAAVQTVSDSNAASTLYHPFKGGIGFGFSFQHQLLKAEEHGFDEPCTSFFSDEQPPTLSWCCNDGWNWADGGGDNNIYRRQGPF